MDPVLNCPLCGSTGPRSQYKVRDRHYKNEGEFTYHICNSCGLEFLDPMPNALELMKFYPEDSYYAYTLKLKPDPFWKKALRFLLFLEFKTKDPSFANPGRMLDVGCGNGWFIYSMREQGWEVSGVEPSKAAVEAGKRMANLDIHHGDLLSTHFPDNHFDYIRFNHSFEHIPNPAENLNEVRRILKPGGKALIGVPNIASVSARLFGKYWYYLGAPVHTFNFSGKTLSKLVSNHGFKNIEVKYNGNWRGFCGSIQIMLNWDTNRTSEEGFVPRFIPFRIISGFISKCLNLFRSGDVVEVIFEK
jgi:SAM-dependent methyltransferase